MSKNTIGKAHIQQSLASKIWENVKRHFQKPNNDQPVSETSLMAIQQDLALIEDENLDTRVPKKISTPSQEYMEFEVEITLDELQDALALLEKQNQNLMSADDALKKLIDTLKKPEKTEKVESEKLEKNSQDSAQKPELEVVVEFIPLSTPVTSMHRSFQQTTVYRDTQVDSMNERIKKEKEQRELAKKITHYPPSDRLH